MKISEQVVFGGSKLDRAAQLRADTDKLEALRAKGDILPIWRGKVLVHEDARGAALRLECGHPFLENSTGEYLFLGLEGDRAIFATDVSSWEPEQQDLATVGDNFDASEQACTPCGEGAILAELRAIMSVLDPRSAELLSTAKALLNWHASHKFCAKCGAPSVMAVGGWQRNCPACSAPHFPRTDPVVIMLVTRGNKLLIGRSPFWPEGMYSTLAGFVEPGEPIEAAVRREVFEETAIRVGRVDYLASQPWAFPSSLMIGCHGFAENEDIVIDPVEIEDARWVTREEMAAIVAGENAEIYAPRVGSIAHFMIVNWLADRLE
ncbi:MULTISPECIES: NAD(+) diphosphatase [Halocynthiibacter]|uniref:NAD(+) diphosphatase n=1 Tax=Halocynthiibacter halioticoli TaxID=2986804 RepID=A0AAE3IWL4_9RHOB|nr:MULTISPECIES: NAD(+) diphosphatase [Halocynthiibacter]MCV6823329.1 NAD(+) diphosphatase [Halocynthiibacter halioticoli]MCW4056330.1 NAD(+) diphosphatase [Halocynthiibacter sp. SDUM655004]